VFVNEEEESSLANIEVGFSRSMHTKTQSMDFEGMKQILAPGHSRFYSVMNNDTESKP
jgi:hypothetical protein